MELVKFDFSDGSVENHAGFLECLHTVDRVDRNSLQVLTCKVVVEKGPVTPVPCGGIPLTFRGIH